MKNYIKLNIRDNPLFFFIPLLILYVSIALLYPTKGIVGDEARYIYFANNILKGSYSPSPPDINLWNGPGYPLFLVPFVLFKIPIIFITISNAFLYYLSVVILYKVLNSSFSKLKSIFFSLVWALSFNMFKYITLILTEVFVAFIITLFLFFLVKSFGRNSFCFKNLFTIAAGLTLGYIALTKIIFGYVLLVLVILSLFSFYFYKNKEHFKRASLIFIIALAFNIPYLAYTYSITGKSFYWSDSGGMSLYWMSSPNDSEYGDWIAETLSLEYRERSIPGTDDTLKLFHKEVFDKIHSLKGVEKDDLFKKIAILNIKQKPIKYIKNWICNMGRLFLNYPYSYTIQRPANLLNFPINMFIFFLMLFSSIISIINWKKTKAEIKIIIVFIFVYLFLSSLVSAYIRQFLIVIPLLIYWIAYSSEKSILIKFRVEDNNSK